MAISLSRTEKKAVARVLTDIVLADSVISKEEAAFMSAISSTFGIPLSDIKTSQKMSVARCITILKGMDLEKKKELGILMIAMIAIDGDVDENEVKLVSAICIAADIPLPDLKK